MKNSIWISVQEYTVSIIFLKIVHRYHSENWSHANFNSKEIGSKLAESVLGLFDPTLEDVGDKGVESSPSDGDEEKMSIPRYKDAVVELAKLPGMPMRQNMFWELTREVWERYR